MVVAFWVFFFGHGDRLHIICQYEKYLEQLLNGFIIAHQIWPTSEDHCWNYRVITHHILLDLFFCDAILYIWYIYIFFWFSTEKIVMGLWILVIGLVQNLVVHFSEYSFDFSLITIEKWSKNFIFNFFLSMTFFCQNNKMKWKILHFQTKKKWAHDTFCLLVTTFEFRAAYSYNMCYY